MFSIFIRDRRAPRRPRRQVRGGSRPVSGHRGRTERTDGADERSGRTERTNGADRTQPRLPRPHRSNRNPFQGGRSSHRGGRAEQPGHASRRPAKYRSCLSMRIDRTPQPTRLYGTADWGAESPLAARSSPQRRGTLDWGAGLRPAASSDTGTRLESSGSCINPQRWEPTDLRGRSALHQHSTSNHNRLISRIWLSMLYSIKILHQTTTPTKMCLTSSSCTP